MGCIFSSPSNLEVPNAVVVTEFHKLECDDDDDDDSEYNNIVADAYFWGVL